MLRASSIQALRSFFVFKNTLRWKPFEQILHENLLDIFSGKRISKEINENLQAQKMNSAHYWTKENEVFFFISTFRSISLTLLINYFGFGHWEILSN